VIGLALAFPFPESVLNAMVLGVAGLFIPPVVPGVRGTSLISHGCCGGEDSRSVEGSLEWWGKREREARVGMREKRERSV